MKRSDLPSLDDLRAFEVVARLGSVRAAAEELSLTHGAISRRVNKLSGDLDIPLLAAKGRGIVVTPEGAILAKAATSALAQIGEALSTIREGQAEAPVVLSCERSIAMRWLIPRLSRFQDAHPDVPVHLSVGGGALDFARDGVSIAVRRLDFPIDPSWRVSHLVDEANGLVMAPDLLSAFRTGAYVGLASRTRPAAWETWMAQNPDAPMPKEIRHFDHHFLLAEAAASGLGVALCPHLIAVDDIARGRLVAPLGFARDGSRYGLIRQRQAEAQEGAEMLADWLMATFHAAQDQGC